MITYKVIFNSNAKIGYFEGFFMQRLMLNAYIMSTRNFEEPFGMQRRLDKMVVLSIGLKPDEIVPDSWLKPNRIVRLLLLSSGLKSENE